MKTVFALALAVLMAWIAANHMRVRSDSEGDGGMGSALIAWFLYFLAIAFALIATARVVWGIAC